MKKQITRLIFECDMEKAKQIRQYAEELGLSLSAYLRLAAIQFGKGVKFFQDPTLGNDPGKPG